MVEWKKRPWEGLGMKKRMVVLLTTLCFTAVSTLFTYADEAQDKFLVDMAEGLNARWAYDSNESAMSSSEVVEYRSSLVNEEYNRLAEYRDAEFENEKFDLMAHAYIEAIEMQVNALKYYTELSNLYEIEWSAGYNLRAALIPNFVDLYGLDVAEEDIADFRNASTTTYSLDVTTDVENDEQFVVAADEEIELYNNEGIKIVITGMDEPDLYSTNINIRIENLNHHDILVSTSDYQVVVNGTMMSSSLWAEVQSGKSANTTMTFYQNELDDAGVDRVRELSFDIMISDAESYMPIYTGEEKFLVISDDYKISEKSVYTDKDTIQKVQTLLNSAGYDCGSADGVPGKKTNNALLQFEKDHGLPETTDITPELVEALEAAIG